MCLIITIDYILLSNIIYNQWYYFLRVKNVLSTIFLFYIFFKNINVVIADFFYLQCSLHVKENTTKSSLQFVTFLNC
jgi:hypothetical protein